MTSKYQIKDLERLSGIKAHTIRIWEQRYHILQPERTDTNIRFYSNDDLRLLLNVSFLNNHGWKISKIAALNTNEIHSHAAEILTQGKSADEHINALIVSMVELNEYKFNSVLNIVIAHDGFETAVEKVLYPFLDRLGIMWQTGTINPAQEHFISNLIRQKFIAAIDKIEINLFDNPKKIILFLPDGELHELSLLYYNYLIKSKGHQTFYLGQSVPWDDLVSVINIIKPTCLLTITTVPLQELSPQDFIDKLHSITPLPIYITGQNIHNTPLKLPSNIKHPKSIEELKQIILQF